MQGVQNPNREAYIGNTFSTPAPAKAGEVCSATRQMGALEARPQVGASRQGKDLFFAPLAPPAAGLAGCVREANKLATFKVIYITNLLQPPGSKHYPVYPQNSGLLNITYERSDLAKYDDLI